MTDENNDPSPKNSETLAFSTPEVRDIQGLLNTTAIFPDTAIKEGIEISGYKLIEFIDKGAHGVVYKAHCPKRDQIIALKLLNPQNDDQTFTERFIREAKIMARFNHPNILTVYDTGNYAEGRHFIAMEFIEGKPLDLIFHEQGQLTQESCIKYLHQTAEALAEIHSKGLIHRDIKPANIMLNNNDQAIVMDFGLAREQDESRASQKLTRDGICVGTPLYMPPEQFESKKKLTSSSDIYALGLTFYEALTGQSPIKGESLQQIVSQKIRGNIEPLSRHDRNISPRLNTLIMDMLCKNPKSRPADGKALIDRLKHLESRQQNSGYIDEPQATPAFDRSQDLMKPQDLYGKRGPAEKQLKLAIAIIALVIIFIIILIVIF